jgi:hypothetical protein
LDLQKQLVVGVITNRSLYEIDSAAGLAELFQEQDLIGITPRQAVRTVNRDDIDLPFAGRVAQAVKGRPIQAGSRTAVIEEDMLGLQLVAVRLGPTPQGGKLTVDRLITLLATR